MKNVIEVKQKSFKEFEQLPFVRMEGKGKNRLSSFWSVPDNLNYVEACRLGNIYAIYFMQYLVDSEMGSGLNVLSHMVKDMQKITDTDSKGVEVGFFTALQGFLHFAASNSDMWRWLHGRVGSSLALERVAAAENFAEKTGTQIISEVRYEH